MKTKKVIVLGVLVGLFATVGYANNLIEGLGFVAPSIIGKSNVYSPAVGEIIYDQSDATFYGYDHSSQWLPLTGDNGPSMAVAILKDIKSAGTEGGTATSGSWQTRALNTEDDPHSLVSLSGNQFTLQAGTYEIEAQAPAFLVGRHKTKLRNITDSTDALIGSGEYSDENLNGHSTNNSFIRGLLVLSSAKTFEVQHRVEVTRSTYGYGLASNFGVSEVYTTVKITQIE